MKLIGTLPGYGTTQKEFRMFCHGFVVESPNMPHFKETAGGLHVYAMSTMKKDAHLLANITAIDKKKGNGIRLVEENKKKYTDRDVERADRARRFQELSGSSLATFLDVVDNNLLKNNPITRDDVKMTEDIYGTCVSNLQGKTARKKVPHVEIEIKTVPKSIMDKYRAVTLCVDIMFVNGI